MFQFSKYPMDILEMLSGHQAHQFKGLGLERQLQQHQQQVQLQHQQQLQQQHQQPGDPSGSLLSGLGLSSRGSSFADSSSIFAKMSAPPPPISHQSQSSSSSSHSSRKSSKMSSSGGGGSSSSGYPQFLRPFHPAEAALAQEQLHSGMGRFDFGGSSSGGGAGVIGGVVTSAPPPPPLHPGLSVPQPSSGPSSSSPSPSSSASASNNPSGSSAVPLSQSDPRSLHQQFSCMLAANQYFLSGVPTNSSLEQFLVQQGGHNHLGLGLGQGASDSNSALAPPPALHSSHSHGHPTSQPQQQQQQLPPHALSHPHSHPHPHHPLHPAPQPAPLGGFDFQGIPVLSSNQIASLMQQEAAGGLPLPLPLHLSLSKDEGKGDSGSGSSGSGGGGGGSGGSRRKKAMAGYLPQRKSDSTSHSSSSVSNCHSGSTSGQHSQNASSGLDPRGSGSVGISGIGSEHSSLLSSSTQPSSTVSSSSSSAPPSSSSTSVLVTNGGSQLPKPVSLNSPNNMASGGGSSQPESEPLYHCGECGKTFTHLSSLRRHLRSHGLSSDGPMSSGSGKSPRSPSPDRTFCCSECGKGFKKRGHLLQHGVIHSGTRSFVCSICQRSFNRRESLTRHEKIHDEKPFRCPACGRCFRESTSLLNHAASGTCGKPPRSSKPRSSTGSEGSSTPGHSKSSMVASGGGDRAGLSGEGKYGPSDYSRNRYQPSYSVDDYRRQQANQSLYSGESSLGNGMGSQTLRKAPLAPTLHPHPQSQQQQHHHHQPHLPLSSLLDDSEDEVTSSAMSAIAAAAAASCDINTENRGEERRDIIGGLLGGLGFGNMVSPSGRASSTSDMDKSYHAGSGSTMPLTHPSHPKAKPRKPRPKREPGAVVRRRRSPGPRGDGSDRPHVCNVCGKRFRRGETLRRHERVHTGEKAHACDVCGKTFREAFHLTKHLTVHSGQKNYKCNLCGKEFAYAQSLVRHGKLHRKGEIDGNGVKVKGGAISQVDTQASPESYYPYAQDKPHGSASAPATQPGQRLYTCTVCWKGFRHHFHLTAHQQTVHGSGGGGEKSFRCEVCGKAFAYSNSLSRHRMSQHGLGRSAQGNPSGGARQGGSQSHQSAGYSPLFYEAGGSGGATYLAGSNVTHPGSSHQGQHHSFQYRSQKYHPRRGMRKLKKKKKRRVEIHSIMRGGQLVGVPLSKETRRKLLIMRRKKGRMQKQLARKKLLAQLRIKGGGQMNVRAWQGGAVRVTGLTSMETPIKRFPCPICPSTTFARQASVLIHHALRHPPRNAGRQARLKCPVCGKRSRTLRRALKHRGYHLTKGSFSCRKCRCKFWNGTLLDRHRVSCRGLSGGGSGNWSLKVMKSPSREAGARQDGDALIMPPSHPTSTPVERGQPEPVQPQLIQPERTTVVTEYSH